MVRFRAQRERLLHATAVAHLEGEGSVTRVTALSGVGRNTFYECFDDFEHALEAARRDELQRFRRGLSGLREDAERGVELRGDELRDDAVTVLCRAWLELIAARPVRALAALEPVRGEQGSALLVAFREALARLSRGSAKREDGALFHAAVCAEASGRTLALTLLGSQGTPRSALVAEGGGDEGSVPSETVVALSRAVRCLVGV